MFNRLEQEKSPYLLQHAHNPVDWYPWGTEAFEKAKKEDKPIFLSIGYSTCHWCHVMERESFENEEIARVMNENFVCIKVDREERPDIDQIYMKAVQGMTGSGGWPLSAFLNHDLEPFWGGTYFPPEERFGRPGFREILLEIVRIWKIDRPRLLEAGHEIGAALKETGQGTASGKGELPVETLRRACAIFEGLFDPRDGGFGGAPKFPQGEAISLLLRIHQRTGEKRPLEMATFTLEKMARGGIYDHVGGGFHRYATDAQWLVPHFEKMLYDNALLAKTYLEAFQIDGNPMWSGVARETLDYVLRDMTSPEGGFYSAQDADSEGVEGKYYVWSEEEAGQFFRTSPTLYMPEGIAWSARYEEPLASARKKLLKVRYQRIPPHKDDKILASWNGLMISAMAFGARVLGEEKYREAASIAADFLLKKLWDGRTLKRRYRDGEARFTGSLDDYAFLIQGLLDLHETDRDPRWLETARALQSRSDELFWDEKDGGYFFSDASDPSLIARSKDIYDGAVPSGNSVETLNLLKLHSLTREHEYENKAVRILQLYSDVTTTDPHSVPTLLIALDRWIG